MNRREFIQHTIVGGAATTLGVSVSSDLNATRVQWPIGCFNRPWTTWRFDDALKQIKAAGYQTTGLLTRTKDEAFIGADATPESLARLKQRIADAGLKATMGALRSRHNIPLDESIKEVRRQIENADGLKLTCLEELQAIAQHVTGFCAKDCGAVKGDVMIQFGTGKVNFAAVFGALKAAGFDGPIMVECCKVGASAEETMANARANRTFLEKVLPAV